MGCGIINFELIKLSQRWVSTRHTHTHTIMCVVTMFVCVCVCDTYVCLSVTPPTHCEFCNCFASIWHAGFASLLVGLQLPAHAGQPPCGRPRRKWCSDKTSCCQLRPLRDKSCVLPVFQSAQSQCLEVSCRTRQIKSSQMCVFCLTLDRLWDML